MTPGRAIALDQLVLDEAQPRRSLDSEALARLQTSMAANGLIQPIVVTPVPGRSDRFRIVAGWRRAEAARKLGWRSIEAVTVAATTPLAQAAENTARAGLSTAELMGVVADAHAGGQSALAIAEALGVSDRLVRYYLTVLEHPDLVESVGNGMSLRAAVTEAGNRRRREPDPAAVPADDTTDANPADRRRRRRAWAATERLAGEWAELDEATRAELAQRLSDLVNPEPDRASRAGGAGVRPRSDPGAGGP